MGNSTPVPSVTGVNLTLNYSYTVGYTPNGGSTTYECLAGGIVVSTNGTGGFSFTITLPTGGCTGSSCTTYSGPYFPASLALRDPAPLGYFLNGSVSPPFTRLQLVAAFDHLAIAPAGPKTVSVSAPTPFTAVATDALGSPSPATLTGTWSVDGLGWGLNPSTGSSTVVTARSGSGPTLLTFAANATFRGRALPPRSTSIELNAVATDISFSSFAPTTLDIGIPATVELVGSGAEGYDYTASVTPGLGQSPVSAPCSGPGGAGGTVELNCSLRVEYSAAGMAQPVVNLTNGYSTATWTFVPVTVAPALELEVAPDPIRAYLADPVDVTVSVGSSTGTRPYGPACLTDGAGARNCSTGAGPSWTFPLTFGSAGSFRAIASVLDAAGANVSVSVPVEVAALPSLGALVASPPVFTAGGGTSISALLSSGLAPYAYWWNGSDPTTTLSAGALLRAGPLTLGYTSGTAGDSTITLTVIDALGTKVAESTTVYVEPGPAVELTAGPEGLPTYLLADAAEAMSWYALAPTGAMMPQYSTSVLLTLTEPAGAPVYLNSSLLGPVAPGANGSFELPPSAWHAGYLNFTLTLPRAGPYTLALAVDLPVAFAPDGSFRFLVGPMLTDLRLVDPFVALAGVRENHTRWQLVDPFGNPATAGRLFLTEAFDGSSTNVTVPIRTNATAAWAWVNYSAPGPGGGTVQLRSEWGELLLGPIAVPGAPAAPDLLTPIVVGLLAGTVALWTAVALRRRRSGPPPAPGSEADPEELRRYAEGRAELLDRLRLGGPLGLEELLPGRLSRGERAEAVEWLASLVTEGLVRAELGEDGEPRFSAAPRSSGARPRVEVDPTVLDRLLRAREVDEAKPDGPRPD